MSRSAAPVHTGMVLVITCSGLFIVGLDVTVVNVALPSIAADLHTRVAGLQWTVDAYTLVMAGLMMLLGAAGDRFGRKRLFIAGLAVFSLGSLASSLAPSVGVLVACRVVQAVGGAALNPIAVSILTNTFTDPRQRARAVGIRGATFGVSLALGPIVGGALVAALGWQAIFLVNVPVGAAAMLLAARYLPESQAPVARRFDGLGQFLVAALLVCLTFAIIEGPADGWSSPVILGAFAAAGAAVAGFVVAERRSPEPLIDLRFFRSVPFSAASAIAILAFGGFGGFLFLNTLYLQSVRRYSPLHAGLATLPLALAVTAGSLVSGRIVGRRGARIPLAASGACCVAGCLLLTGLSPATSFAWLALSYVIFGFGFGLVNTPVTDTAVSGMPRARAGVASAVASTSRQVGQTLGVAVVGAIAGSAAGASGTLPRAFAASTHPAWWVLAAGSLTALGLGLLATSARARHTAHQVAVALNPEAIANPSAVPAG